MRTATLSVLVTATLLALSGSVKSASPLKGPSIVYTIAKEYDVLAWMKGRDRFPFGATIFIQDERGYRPLIKEFAASADPAVSFDARRILFAGKGRKKDHWQIWELVIASGEMRQVSSCADDCFRPLYLPDDNLTYATKIDKKTVIEVARLSGDKALPVTYGPGNFLPTDVLRDGRILFQGAQPFSKEGTSEIYTVYTDGSGVESYRCDHGPLRHSGKEIASGDIVFARGRTLSRFTSAQAHEEEIKVPPADYAGDVVEASGGDWLVTSRSNSHQQFKISRWERGTKSLVPFISGREGNAIQPTLLQERPVPNRHPSGLHD
jgi:hypothetical protein